MTKATIASIAVLILMVVATILSTAPKSEASPEPTYNLQENEQRLIKDALKTSGGDTTTAAKKLGISEGALKRRLREISSTGNPVPATTLAKDITDSKSQERTSAGADTPLQTISISVDPSHVQSGFCYATHCSYQDKSKSGDCCCELLHNVPNTKTLSFKAEDNIPSIFHDGLQSLSCRHGSSTQIGGSMLPTLTLVADAFNPSSIKACKYRDGSDCKKDLLIMQEHPLPSR